jgi:hypothetical protein
VRRTTATLVVLAATALLPAAASSQPRVSTHCCYVISVAAVGEYEIDYGEDLGQQKTGTYVASWVWDTKTIAAYEAGGLTARGPGLLFALFTEEDKVNDVLSSEDPPYAPYPVREKCDGFHAVVGQSKSHPAGFYTKVSPETRNRFAQLDTDFKVSPGRAVSNWNGHCAQVDGPASHGLNAFLAQTMPVSIRKLKRQLADEKDFSVGCWESVAPPVHKNPTPHTFEGRVEVRVNFDYFPFSKLDDREAALNDLVTEKRQVIRHLGDLLHDATEAMDEGGGHDCGA